jgi:hypothetical protein
VPSRQRYEHLALAPTGATVRYSSGTFHSDLKVDRDGFVIAYPTMAERLDPKVTTDLSLRATGTGSVRPS